MGAPIGGERLPMAPRERKPALAALAVLLILVGALGATVMVMRAGNKIEVVEITDSVAAGQPIPAGAITEVEVSDVSDVKFIRWSQRGDLLKNWRASINLKKGMLLTAPMITQGKSGLAADKAIVGLSLKDGQFPPGLQAGDVVAAYRVGNDVAKSSGTAGTAGGDSTPLLSNHLVVLDVKTSSGDFSSGNTSVKIEVDSSEAGPLTAAASSDDVALVLVSGTN